MPQWEEAKRQFNESGLLTIFQKVIDLKRAESYYIDPENFDRTLYWKWAVGAPYFYAELYIERSVREHDEYYFVGGYSNKIATKYVGVRTDKDGAVSFYGKKHPFDHKGGMLVKVPKTKWQGNVGALEDALGRVYYHPLTSEKREIYANPRLN